MDIFAHALQTCMVVDTCHNARACFRTRCNDERRKYLMETALFREATFDTGKVVLNYAEGPAAGPPLVMLHGGGGRWQLYSGMLAELAECCHVYAPDLRGHGKSGWVPWGY